MIPVTFQKLFTLNSDLRGHLNTRSSNKILIDYIYRQILTNIPLNTEAVRFGTIFQHMPKGLNQYISLGRNQRIPSL